MRIRLLSLLSAALYLLAAVRFPVLGLFVGWSVAQAVLFFYGAPLTPASIISTFAAVSAVFMMFIIPLLATYINVWRQHQRHLGRIGVLIIVGGDLPFFDPEHTRFRLQEVTVMLKMLAEQMEVKQVVQCVFDPFANATASIDLLAKGQLAQVSVSQTLLSFDDEVVRFVLAHELAHLELNDITSFGLLELLEHKIITDRHLNGMVLEQPLFDHVLHKAGLDRRYKWARSLRFMASKRVELACDRIAAETVGVAIGIRAAKLLVADEHQRARSFMDSIGINTDTVSVAEWLEQQADTHPTWARRQRALEALAK